MKNQAINHQPTNSHLPHITAKALCWADKNTEELKACSYFQKTLQDNFGEYVEIDIKVIDVKRGLISGLENA